MSQGGVTIRQMEEVALGLNNDLGNVIDINDSSDVLGLNMLANQGKISYGNNNNNNGHTVNVAPPTQSISNLEFSNLETLEPISLDANTFGSSQPPQINVQFQPENNVFAQDRIFNNEQTATGPNVNYSPASQNPEKEKKEKIEFLNKLQRLEQKGFQLSKKFTMDNTYDEIKQEYDRLVDARNLESSLRFQRQALMGVVTGLQWMNEKFDPMDAKLEGWSESVHENVEDFDEIFEELYDKYKERGKMPPEVRLMFSLAGSGFMCHVSNTYLRAKMPSADEVLRNNPDLARQFAQAAANQAGPGFGNMMGMMMPGGPQQTQPQTQQPQGNAGAFFGSSAQQLNQVQQQSQQELYRQQNTPQVIASVEPSRQTARREMKGPSGVDDILKTFQEVRQAEVAGLNMDPNLLPQQQQHQQSELESIVSGDIGSVSETRGGRRRGRKPIGNTISLDV